MAAQPNKDPWQPYESQAGGMGKGKQWPPVPEPATYGFWLVGLCLVLVLLARWDNRARNTRK